jgi:hypothetical protein
MPHLQPCDLTICYNNEDGTASAGGYKIESLLLAQGSSPMTTVGGGKKPEKNRVSDCLRDLAIPAGLLCTTETRCLRLPMAEDKGVIERSLYDRLLELAAESESSSRKKSRSRRSSTSKGTRKRH